MAAVALTTSGRLNVVQSETQLTLGFAESCNIGQPVRIDASTGKWTKANGTDATESYLYGILVSKDAAGAVGTAVRKGIVDGFAITAMDYNAKLYLSDTDGTVADAAGTVSVVIGRVIPGTGVTTGTSNDRLFFIDL